MSIPSVNEWPAVLGTRAEVALVMRHLSAAQVAHVTDPEPIPGAPGRVSVRYLPLPNPHPARPAQHARPTARVTRTERTALVFAGGALVGAAAGIAAMLAVQWLLAHLLLIAGVLIALAALLWLAGRAGVCPGIHCPGCRHR